MEKLNRPTGLISYTSENELKGKKRTIGIRSLIYLLILIFILIGLVTSLNIRKEISVQFLRGSKTPFSLIKKADLTEVVNHYKIKINYYGSKKYNLSLKYNSPDLKIIMPMAPLEIQNENKETDVFFKFPVSFLTNGSKVIKVKLLSDENVIKELEVKLVGPFK